MKKLMITMLSATLMFIMSACTADGTTNDKNLNPQESNIQLQPGLDSWEESEAVKALNQVLTMEAAVRMGNKEDGVSETVTYKEHYLNAIQQLMEYNFEENLVPDNYAVVDMDRDNTPEVIVNLSSGTDGWIVVLRYYEGSVYGYPFVYRGLESPKKDGTYMASSGAFDNSILEMSFEGPRILEKVLAGSISINGSVEYYIEAKMVSEDEFNDYTAAFSDKEDVSWQKFSSESGL